MTIGLNLLLKFMTWNHHPILSTINRVVTTTAASNKRAFVIDLFEIEFISSEFGQAT